MTMQQLSQYGILPTWDLGLVVFLFILILFYEISSGKSRFLLTLLSTYFSFVIVYFFPFWRWFEEAFGLKEFFYLKILFFGGLVFLFTLLLSRSILGSFFSFAKRKIGHFFQTLLFSILQTGLLASMGFSFLPEEYYGDISPLVFKILLEDFSRFLWILLPIAALVVVKKKKEKIFDEPRKKRFR